MQPATDQVLEWLAKAERDLMAAEIRSEASELVLH